MTIQQWVASQVDTPNETVTLRPLAVPGALDAATITASPTATANLTKPFDAEPFSQTIAMVEGSQYFYQVVSLIALEDATDTGSPYSWEQLDQQVVTTFVVP
jgi:hypothetical protein